MEIKDFIKNIAEQYDEIDENRFTPETKFKEFDEWCSLTALSILAMIGAEYGIKLKGSELKGVKTIIELFELVKTKS